MSAGINAKASIDGAKKFQDDLKNMTARSKALDAEMKEMTARFEKDGKAMGDNAKQRELANKQIDAQKQKIALLAGELKKLEDAGEGESTAAYKLREQLAKANTELTNMEHATDGAASKSVNFTSGLGKMALGAGAAVVAVKAAVGVIKSIASAAGKAAKAVWNLGVESGQWADELITLSNQTGVDTETLQEWRYASRFIDTEVSTMTKSMVKLRQATTKKNGATKKAIKIDKKHTVALKDKNGKARAEVDVFYDVIDALHDMDNVQARNRKAQELFGKSYTEMIPLIESGSGALRQYAQEARDMGIIISGSNVAALGDFDDQMQRFDATMSAIKTNLAVAFLPILELVSDRLVEFMGTVSQALSDGLQPEDVGTIVDAFFNMFKVDNGDGTTEQQSAFAFIGELVNRLKTEVSNHKDDIKDLAKQVMGFIWDAFKELIGIDDDSMAAKIWNGITTVIKSALGLQTTDVGLEEGINGTGMTAAEWWAAGFEDGYPEIEDAGEGALGEVEKSVGPSAHSKSTHWGQEMADGLAAGIEAGIPRVSQAANKLAAAAAAPIHFSLPDEGPLRKIGLWGGEMIDQYVRGIKANAWKVSSALGSTLGVSPVNPAVGGSTTNMGGVTIIVNGAAGQDVNALADIVMERMQSAVSRREAVFA